MTGPKRIQLSRAKGWRKPEGAIVVARPSKWGNPWYISGATVRLRGVSEELLWADRFTEQQARETAVRTYAAWLNGKYPGAVILRDQRIQILDSMSELRGRGLACWCPLDQPCHADVLLEIANRGTEGAQ